MSQNNMKYIHDLLAKLDSRLDDIHEVQIRHDENLKTHMKRSDANEEAIEMLKKHVNMVNGVMAFVGFIITIIGLWAAFK